MSYDIAERGLLAPDEPAPFELVNEAGQAPVLLVCDHAASFLPRALGSLGLDQAALARHIAWDIGIAEVTRGLATLLDAPAVLSRFSRLIIDPNRALDDPTLIPQISDGIIVPGNRALPPSESQARITCFFDRYHEAVNRTLAAMLGRGLLPAVVSMHSFTPVMKGEERPWQIGVLWNKDPRLPQPLMAKLRAKGVVVGENEPYSGRDGHGYTLHAHAEPRGLANVLIEVRQDLIDTHRGAADWAVMLGDTLSEVLGDPGIFKAEHHHQ